MDEPIKQTNRFFKFSTVVLDFWFIANLIIIFCMMMTNAYLFRNPRYDTPFLFFWDRGNEKPEYRLHIEFIREVSPILLFVSFLLLVFLVGKNLVWVWRGHHDINHLIIQVIVYLVLFFIVFFVWVLISGNVN